jgi:hypothetical protein
MSSPAIARFPSAQFRQQVKKPTVLIGNLLSAPSQIVFFHMLGSKAVRKPGSKKCFAGVDHFDPYFNSPLARNRWGRQ